MKSSRAGTSEAATATGGHKGRPYDTLPVFFVGAGFIPARAAKRPIGRRADVGIRPYDKAAQENGALPTQRAIFLP